MNSRYKFTQPTCGGCFSNAYPEREPIRLKEEYREIETCCKCGSKTKSGIYIRVDPGTVAYPTLTK